MKNILSALAAAALALPLAVQGQPSLGTPTVINVGGVAIAPQGVEIANDEVIGNGFTNQVVFRIADPLGAATVSQVASFSASVPWGPSRGPQDIDVLGNTAYVFADDGTVGRLLTIDLSTDTVGTSVTTTGQRMTGGEIITESPLTFYGGISISSIIRVFDETGAVTTQSAAASPTAPVRDIVTNGTDLYYISSAGTFAIGEFTGLAAAGDFTGSTNSEVLALAGGGTRNHLGIDLFDDGTTLWIVAPETGGTDNSIVFVDASDSSNVLRLGTADLAGLQLTGLDVGQIGGTDYVAVASQNGGVNANEVYLFEIIVGGTSVGDWTLLQ